MGRERKSKGEAEGHFGRKNGRLVRTPTTSGHPWLLDSSALIKYCRDADSAFDCSENLAYGSSTCAQKARIGTTTSDTPFKKRLGLRSSFFPIRVSGFVKGGFVCDLKHFEGFVRWFSS